MLLIGVYSVQMSNIYATRFAYIAYSVVHM